MYKGWFCVIIGEKTHNDKEKKSCENACKSSSLYYGHLFNMEFVIRDHEGMKRARCNDYKGRDYQRAKRIVWTVMKWVRMFFFLMSSVFVIDACEILGWE